MIDDIDVAGSEATTTETASEPGLEGERSEADRWRPSCSRVAHTSAGAGPSLAIRMIRGRPPVAA